MSDQISSEIEDGLIQEILNHFTISDDGKAEPGAGNIFAIWHNIDILNSVLQEKTDFFKKLKKNRYSFQSESEFTYRVEFIDIFKKLKGDNKTSFKDFEEEFSKKLTAIAKIEPKEFTLIYPLNLKFVKKIESEIKGDKFGIISFQDFTHEFLDVRRKIREAKEIDDRKTELKFYPLVEICNNEFSYLVIKAYARNYEFAVEYATDRLLRVLGLLTLAKYGGIETSTISGRATKLSKLSLSKVLVFGKDGFINYSYFNGKIKSLEEMSEEDLDIFSGFLKSINEIASKDIVRILENTLTSYYEASTDDDIANSFFKYWVCIELCLLKSEMITEKEIIKRLKSMLIIEDKYLKLRISWLDKKRNNFVHELNMDILQSDRNLVKLISESLIHFLFYKRLSNNYLRIDRIHLDLKLTCYPSSLC
ncbi:MAG TPA: hypothetical protein VMW67_08580 [Desulfobacteria bacterium]|nr:hypothetical protein [Desulfobacteria bacterium]